MASIKEGAQLHNLDNWEVTPDPRQLQGISNNFGEADTENFFSNKKKKWFTLWTVLLILIIGVAFKSLLNISLLDLVTRLSAASEIQYFAAIMIFGLSTFFVCDVLIKVTIIKLKLKSKLNHISKLEWFNFSVISFLIQSVTPFSIGSEPYNIWWLSKRGVTVREAAATTAVSSICWFIGQFFVTWPSFIYLTVQNWDKVSSGTISTSYWLVLVGLLVDIIVSVFIFVISYVNKAHFFISRMMNEIKRYLGMNYLTRDEVFNKYLRESSFKTLYTQFLFQKSTLKIIALYLIANVWTYMTFALIHGTFLASAGTWSPSFTLNSFNLINVATTSNNFFPLPSSEGSLQIVLQKMMSGIFDYQTGTTGANGAAATTLTQDQLAKINDNTIFVWRFFSKYLGLCIALITIYLVGFNVRPGRSKASSEKLNKIKNLKKYQTPYELVF